MKLHGRRVTPVIYVKREYTRYSSFPGLGWRFRKRERKGMEESQRGAGRNYVIVENGNEVTRKERNTYKLSESIPVTFPFLGRDEGGGREGERKAIWKEGSRRGRQKL